MIRKILPQDRQLYLTMTQEFYNSDAVLHKVDISYMESTFQEMMRSEDYVLGYILEYEGQPAGYAQLSKTFSQEVGGTVILVEELYVRPEYRSHGLGSEFFKFLKDGPGKNARRLRLEVTHSNKRAISLYERMGFEQLDYIQMVLDK